MLRRPGAVSRAAALILTIGIFCVPLLTFLPFLTTPFMRDEAFYASVAQAMRHGAMPYEYGFDNKPPMIFYWYFASFQIFGESVWAPRLLASLLLSGCSALVYAQARLMFGPHRWGLIAAGLFGLSTGIAKFESNANTEYFLIPLLMLALVAFTLSQRTGKWYWYSLCGAASAAAVLTKQTAVFFPVVYLGFILIPLLEMRSLKGSAPAWRSVAHLAAGGAVASVVVLVPFVITGSLGEVIRGPILYAAEYSAEVTWQEKLTGLLNTVPRQMVKTAGPWTLLAVIGTTVIARKPSRETALVLAWVAAACAGVLAAGRFYPHYFVTLLPGMALLAVPALKWLRQLQVSDRSFQRRAFLMAAVVLALVAVWPAISNGRVYLQSTPDARHMQKYDGNPMSQWEVQARDAGAWIAGVTRPGEKIYEFGFMPSVYFYADRESPTQYSFKHPFAVDEKYARDAIRQMESEKPVLIFDSARYENDSEFAYRGRTIMAFIEKNYVYAGKLYFGDLWVLRGWEPARPLDMTARG